MAGVELLLAGKTALITGGSRGIGAETVRLFRAAGARVAFSYRQAGEAARRLEEECGRQGAREQGNEGTREQGAREQGSEGTREQGAREQGSEGTREQENEGTREQGNERARTTAGLRGISGGGSAAARGRGAGLPTVSRETLGWESLAARLDVLRGTPLGGKGGEGADHLGISEAEVSRPPGLTRGNAGPLRQAQGGLSTWAAAATSAQDDALASFLKGEATSVGNPPAGHGTGEDLIQCVGIEQELETAADGRALVEKAVAALGRLDILVVNHGIWPAEDAPIETMSEAQWRRTMGVNLDAVFGVVAQFARQWSGVRDQGSGEQGAREQGSEGGGDGNAGPSTPSGAKGAPDFAQDDSSLVRPTGHIVLISSTAGQRGEAFHADYAASKGALISLTKSLSSELAPKGILVNCVAPGWVETDMSAGTLADAEKGAQVVKGIPVGRVASPREIAGPVLFLCTPLAGFISGEVLNVNGGAVLAG